MVSVGVDVCTLVLPELINVYGQIFLPVHVTDTADALLRQVDTQPFALGRC